MVRGRLAEDSRITELVDEALGAARGLDNIAQMARTLQTAAELAAESGDFKRLATAEQEATTIAKSGVDEEAVAYGNMTTGFCLWTRGRFANAYRLFAKSAASFQRIGHGDLVRALNGQAMCAWSVGEMKITIDCYERALFYAQRTGDYGIASNVAANTATALMDLGAFDEAGKVLDKALEFDKKVLDNRYTSTVFNSFTMLDLVRQDFKGAAEASQRAEVAARRKRLTNHLAFCFYSQADYYLATGMPEEALEKIAKAQSALSHSKQISYGYQGNSVRLNMYRDWALGLSKEEPSLPEWDTLSLSLPALIEVYAFREWALQRNGISTTIRPNADDMVHATGLRGLRLLMELVGMYPAGDRGPIERKPEVQAS